MTKAWYVKERGCRDLTHLPFTEKVKCVIELQRRIQPIYAQCVIIIKL